MGNTTYKLPQLPEAGSHTDLDEIDVPMQEGSASPPQTPAELDLFRKALEKKGGGAATQLHEAVQSSHAEDELRKREILTQQEIERNRQGIAKYLQNSGVTSESEVVVFQEIVNPGIEGGKYHKTLLDIIAQNIQKLVERAKSISDFNTAFQYKQAQMGGGTKAAINHNRTQEIQGSIQHKERTAGDQSHGGG